MMGKETREGAEGSGGMVDFAGQKKELVLMWDAAAANIVWSRQQEGGTILAAAF